MPSIFTHLLIAEDALDSMPVGPARSCLESNRGAYFLGSLAPDLPYFDMFLNYRGLPLGSVLSPVSHSLEHRVAAWLGWTLPPQTGWSKRLHGLGTERVLQGWALWAGLRRPELLALAAGMVTHLAADEVMHPKINADSGDERSLAGMQRHRELEINLDLMLLRIRGVGIESLSYRGLLESYLGTVDQRGEFLPPSLKQAWVEASQACEPADPVLRRDLDGWSTASPPCSSRRTASPGGRRRSGAPSSPASAISAATSPGRPERPIKACCAASLRPSLPEPEHERQPDERPGLGPGLRRTRGQAPAGQRTPAAALPARPAAP